MKKVHERIIKYNKGRIPPLLKFKYRALCESSFRFYRGTCHLFYENLSKNFPLKDFTKVWICGDLHLENFGAYKGDNRQVYFDMNDFDEAILAPCTWELARMLVSIHVGAHDLGFSARNAERMCTSFLDEYTAVILNGKGMWVDKDNVEGLVKHFLQKLKERKRKDFLKQRIVMRSNGAALRIDHKKTFPPGRKKKRQLIRFFNEWRKKKLFKKIGRVRDAAVRVAGTGSLGLERYVFLTDGKKIPHKHYLIEMKQACAPALAPYVKIKQPRWKNEAARIVSVQQRMQGVCPAMLAAAEFDGKYFVLKELQPTQDKMDLSLCRGKFKKLHEITLIMAQITASAHLRSAGRDGSSITDELISFASGKKWQRQLLLYCKKYAEKEMLNYREYCSFYAGKAFSR